MGNVYILDGKGNTVPMKPVSCRDEGKELQDVLEKNPDLLPGDQIDPDDPRRWILIKREMPVPDPTTGAEQRSIDFLFADQDAIPTFVECKRFGDTRSRREVIGQMFEYAANGQYYWTKEELRSYAEASIPEKNQSLEAALQSIRAVGPEEETSVDSFFDRMITNLREGQVRLIFFLEEGPGTLKSIVDFLNRQMISSEVLLVEAKQYTDGKVRIVVPSLFGYTEQARQVKRQVTVTTDRRMKWDWDRFVANARTHLKEPEVETLARFYEFVQSTPFAITWGTGAKTGSFNLKYERLFPKSLITLNSTGDLWFNFQWYTGTDEVDALRDELKSEMSKKVGLPFPEDYHNKFVRFPIGVWGPKLDALKEVLAGILPRWEQGKT